MDLLKYEFLNSPEGSYNHILGQLVKKIRYYRSNVTVDEFKAALPELQSIERRLQNMDADMAQEEKRFYIQEIMDELSEEDEIERKILSEIEYGSRVIVSTLFNLEFSMEDFSYEFRNSESVSWIEFYGYKAKREDDGVVLVVKEVFRSCSYKQGIIFIDSSLTNN